MLGEASTGAASDLSSATQLAIKMVTEWGLSTRLGPIGYGSDDPSHLNGPQFGRERPYAEGTQQLIDQEVTRLLTEAESRARELLSDNRDELDAVIAALLEKETISGEDLFELVAQTQRPRRGPSYTQRSLSLAAVPTRNRGAVTEAAPATQDDRRRPSGGQSGAFAVRSSRTGPGPLAGSQHTASTSVRSYSPIGSACESSRRELIPSFR